MSMVLATQIHDAVGLPPAHLHESFVQTLLATLFQGAFIAVGLIPLTIAVRLYVVRRERRRGVTMTVVS